jgi:ceramide glucosyltransferase
VSWYWLFSAPAVLLAFLSLRGERKRAAYVARRLSEVPTHLPPASVIVPVKGDDEGLRENLQALSSLDYPDYELIVAARSASDIPPGVLPSRVKIVLVGADDHTGSEKVRNLRTAIQIVRKRSEIFAFADSDGRPTRGWLRALVAPLSEPGIGASTGYRWFTPVPPTFWTLLRGVWDAVVIGRFGPGDAAFAWGGAMAIRKETFFEARVPEYWKYAVSDDYALAAAVHDAGLTIAFAPGALTPCYEHAGALPILSWMRRQLLLTRFYKPQLWVPALAAHIVYCAGMAAALVASIRGNRLAEWALIAQLSPGMLKGLNRAVLAKAALPECEPWFHRHMWVHAIWVPLATWLWLFELAASAFGHTIEWRGCRYDLRPTL